MHAAMAVKRENRPTLSQGTAGSGLTDAHGRTVHRYVSPDGTNSLDYMDEGDPKARPLVVLNSVEYPGWAPPRFSRLAAERGFRTIVVLRPGFGRSATLPDPLKQARLVEAFLEDTGIEGAVLVAMGTANPVAFRLAGVCPHVRLTAFVNCAFNYDHTADFRPEWFARALEQALQSPAGARLSLMGLKSSWGIFGKTWVHENILQKSPGDVAFLRENPALVDGAIVDLIARLDVQTFMMEVSASMKEEAMLQDACFDGVPAIVVTGRETTSLWQRGVEAEAARLGLPLAYLPSGDALCIYQSPVEFFDLLERYL